MIITEQVMLSENRCGGKGTVEVHVLMEKVNLCDHGLGVTRIIIPPGASIGVHQHEKSVEQYHVLTGSGIFHDNGTDKPIKAGETGVINPDEFHGIENTGDENMEIIGVHMYE